MIDTDKSEKKLVIILAIILIIIVVLSLSYVVINGDVVNILFKNSKNNDNPNTHHTAQIQDHLIYVTPDEANELIETDANLKILDVRSCSCKWSAERLTETTEWTEYLQPEKFNDTEYDLLVYCQSGNDSSLNESNYFCSNLIGKTQGMIYTLDGGILNWKYEGYTTYFPRK